MTLHFAGRHCPFDLVNITCLGRGDIAPVHFFSLFFREAGDEGVDVFTGLVTDDVVVSGHQDLESVNTIAVESGVDPTNHRQADAIGEDEPTHDGTSDCTVAFELDVIEGHLFSFLLGAIALPTLLI